MKKIFIYLLLLSSCLPYQEEFSGGETTHFDFSLGAFGKKANNLNDSEKVLKFNRGSVIFKAIWSNDKSPYFQGLGPLFNSNSCFGCHTFNGRGKNKEKYEKEFFSMSFKIQEDSSYGTSLQLKSIDEKKIPPEVSIEVEWEEVQGEFLDGETYTLVKPKYKFTKFAYGNKENLIFSARVAPVVFGMGLLSLIPEEDLQAKEDPNDKNQDGISGKLNYVWNLRTQKLEIGRFGWKASQPTLHQFIATALLHDMGITSELFIKQNCTEVQNNCNLSQNLGMEIDMNSFSDLEYYVSLIGVPARRNTQDEEVLEGKKIFSKLGCIHCHISTWKTKWDPDFPELSHQVIYPYTDLMLHDMGEDLADGLQETNAKGNEWRTPPLWGLGLYETINQHNRLLHDGRARGIEEAILWHGGEALSSKEAYRGLPKLSRKKLLKFLNSL